MAKKASSYAEMSYNELQIEQRKLNAMKAEIKERLREVQAALDEKTLLVEAASKLSKLTPEERAALRQAIEAGGIESGEEFGAP